ncbi:MAG TPA: protein kinase [Acetobacteraceae bacterium]|nr:protein kinase [Acetobacteraceae bacterium]
MTEMPLQAGSPAERPPDPGAALVRIQSAGWELSIASYSRSAVVQPSPALRAVHVGEDEGAPRRGVLAGVAEGSAATPAGARAAAEAGLRGLAEGYFGSSETLGTARAAGNALAAINAWLFGQARPDPTRLGQSVSLSALLFTGAHVGVLHVGECRVYRRRGGVLTALTTDHVRHLPDGATIAARALGADQEVWADYAEEPAAEGDRYIILSPRARDLGEAVLRAGLSDLPPDVVARDLVDAASRTAPGQPMTVLVADVVKPPEPGLDEIAAGFTDLPIRPVPAEGDVWDGFEMRRVLYRSRYTLLMLAQDSVEQRPVVLKIPRPGMLEDRVFHAGFLREAWVGMRVKSWCVARYLRQPAGRQTSLYLVMPFYKGETLEARLHRAPPVGLLEGVRIGLNLAQAVSDLDAIQVIHRDIKPENVMLLPDGSLRLLDLGLAYLPGIDDPGDTRLGGTTRYMAPELFRGVVANARSEVFSIGVTLYRMFSGGRFPFGQREKTALARLRPDLPSWLGGVIASAVTIDPERRLPNAAALAALLEKGLARGDVVLPRAGPGLFGSLAFWRSLTAVFAALSLALLVRVLTHS